MEEYEIGIGTLVGKTLADVIVDKTNNIITFVVDSNEQYQLYHQQSCCEIVYIEDIVGDVADLIGVPIVTAREDTNSEDGGPANYEYTPDSYTWTFYNLATAKGYVTIRWFGESNGYYSERVDFRRL